jgi:G6PDH family F420-dependent oxidoreductase
MAEETQRRIAFGYHLSCEEQPPRALVRNAARAEAAGFELCFISDHYHPWIDAQGQSPFAWSVLGAIAEATGRMRVGTAVTCPTMRYHPALVAQMAATTASLFEGRFFLGVGTGEYLNEHVYGQPWPRHVHRAEMLAEAIGILRRLWEEGLVSHEGRYFTVESARIYSLPEPLPPVYVAAAGPQLARTAAELGDGLIAVAPQAKLVQAFREAGGEGVPACTKAMLCWAESAREAREIAFKWWPLVGLDPRLNSELRLPADFEAALKPVRPEDLEGQIAFGPDPEAHLALIDRYVAAGFDHVVLHQVGPDQDGFFDFWETELKPELERRYGGRAMQRSA